MSRTVWKYTIDIQDKVEFTMPAGSTVIHVAPCGTSPMAIDLWFDADPARDLEWRTFHVHGTGHPIAIDSWHVGSVIMHPFVWHVYEGMRP